MEGFDALSPATLSINGIPQYDVTPDGTRLLVSRAASGVTATEAGEGDDYRRVNVILNFFEELRERVPGP